MILNNLKHIFSFLVIFLFFFELYNVLNYILKIKNKYPLKEIINILVLFSLSSLLFLGFNIANFILSFLFLIYVFTLIVRLKTSIIFDQIVFVLLLITNFHSFNPFFNLSCLIIIYLFYQKDLKFIRNKDLVFYKDHHLSLVDENQVYEEIEKDTSFLDKKDLDLYLSKDLYENILLIKEFLIYPYAFYCDNKKKNKIKKIPLTLIKDKMNEIKKQKYNYSFDRQDYIIHNSDYERASIVDQHFHKMYKFKILDLFSNRCVKTGDMEMIEMDHFIIPKSKGGNFILMHKDGYLLLNAIPLCRSENSNKSNKIVDSFFTNKEIEDILNKIEKINIDINKDKEFWKLFYDRVN